MRLVLLRRATSGASDMQQSRTTTFGATTSGPSTSIYAAILDMDSAELDAFRRRLRRRYSREELITELQACAARIGSSPTMREFAEDPEATIHPQTVVDQFG